MYSYLMPSRDPAITAAYEKYKQTTSAACPFCELGDREIIAESESFVVLRALFPYKIWDECDVHEHLMVLPKRHLTKFSQLTAEESREVLQIFSDYEDRGYSIYARAPQDIMRSITHQHSHLLLLSR